MKFLGTSILPRVFFLVTLFSVSSGVAYLLLRGVQLPSGSEVVEQGLESNGRSEELPDSTPNPSPDSSPETDTTTSSFSSQVSAGIESMAQVYQGVASSVSTNANTLLGSTWASPSAIGGSTPNSAAFTNVTTSGTLLAQGPVTMSQFANGFLLANGIGELSATRISLSNSSQVADRLPTASGGTGNDFSGSAAGSVLSFSATGQMSVVAPGTSGYVLTSNGPGALPSWSPGGAATVDWTNPGTIGSATPNTGSFTRIDAKGSASPLNVGSSSQLQVDDNGRMTIAYVGDSGYLSSSGGALFFNQTNNIGTGIGIYSNAGAEALGNMINVKVDNPNYGQAAFYMNYDGNSNAVEIVSNSDDLSSNALAVTGNNINDSTVGIIGYELARGTVKVSHYRPGVGNDSNASAISVDLKGVGTRAQGLYVDSTETGGTLGNLLRLRNESIDKFVVNYQGNLTLAGNITQGANGTNTTYTKQGNTSGDQFFVGTTGAFRVQRSAGNSEAFRVQVNGDTEGRWLGTSDGQLKWGPGTATQDVVLKRSVAGVMTLDGVLVMNNANQTLDTVIKGSLDSNLFFVNGSTDRIGIGLSTPVAALHISKNTGTLPTLLLNSSGSGDLFTASSSGATRFTVGSTGNVTTSGALSVAGTTTLNTLTYTWPSSGLANGYVLSTNATGTLSWVDPTSFAGTNYWQQNSGVLSPATLTNQLALGTISPQSGSALHVTRNSANNALTVLNQTGVGDILTASSSGTTRFSIAESGNITAFGNITQGVNGTNTSFMKNGNVVGDEFFVGTNGAFRVQRSAAGSEAFRTQVVGDAQGRFLGTSDGQLRWGSGAATQDVTLRRGNAGVLFLDGSIVMNNSNQALDTVIKGSLDSNLLYVNGSTDRIGIGTSSPLAGLHVARNTGTLPSLLLNNTGTGDLFTASASGTTRFTIANNGNVNVGGALTVSTASNFSANGATLALGDGTNITSYINFQGSRTMVGYDGSNATLQGGTSKGIKFNVNNSSFGAGTVAVLDTSGNFGIGLTNPTAPLHVNGAFGGNAAAIFNQTNGNDLLTASASGTTRFTISNTGSVAIGSAAPAARLDITSSSTNSDVLRWVASDGSRLGRFTETAGGHGFFEVDNSSGTAVALLRGDGGQNYISTGTFGLGTNAPTATLHVNSANGGAAAAIFNQANSGVNIMTASASGTTRMVMANDGSIGLGTNTPGYRVDVLDTGNSLNGYRATNSNAGTLAAAAIGLAANNHSAAVVAFSSGYTGGGPLGHFAGRSAFLTDVTIPGDGLDFISAKVSGDQRWYTGGYTTGNERMRLNSSGNLAIGGTDPATNRLKVFGDFEVTGACSGCSSDERLKKNIQQMGENSLEKLLSIKGVSYEWSDAQKSRDFPGLQMGVIAQDVESVFPEIVGTDSRGFKFVRYDKLIAPTIEAIREQQGQISSIDSRVVLMNNGMSQGFSSVFGFVNQKWSVVADIVFTKAVEFKDSVSFTANAVFNGRTQFEKPIAQSVDAAGSVMLPSGSDNVNVVFTSAYENVPFVTLTPVGKGVTGYYLDSVTKQGFTLKVEQSLSQDVMFNWSATQTSVGAVLGTSSASPAPSSAASVAPQSSPAVSPAATPNVSVTPMPSPAASPVIPSVTPSPSPTPELASPSPQPQPSPSSQP